MRCRETAAPGASGGLARAGRAALARRRLLGVGLGVLLLGLPVAGPGPRAASDQQAARALVQDLAADVLAVLRDPALGDRAKLDALVVLLDGPIDLDLVARLILARHWRTASEAQRADYLELFRAYALNTLASRLHLYRGQDFEITGATAVGKNDTLVTTNILDQAGPPLKVDWRLRQREAGDLVAIDLIVEGISLIVSLRSEFGSVVERQGIDGLLAELRQRVERAA